MAIKSTLIMLLEKQQVDDMSANRMLLILTSTMKYDKTNYFVLFP